MSESKSEKQAPLQGASNSPAENEIVTVDVGSLLGPKGMVRIAHQGEIYTLRITRNNRLILTK